MSLSSSTRCLSIMNYVGYNRLPKTHHSMARLCWWKLFSFSPGLEQKNKMRGHQALLKCPRDPGPCVPSCPHRVGSRGGAKKVMMMETAARFKRKGEQERTWLKHARAAWLWLEEKPWSDSFLRSLYSLSACLYLLMYMCVHGYIFTVLLLYISFLDSFIHSVGHSFRDAWHNLLLLFFDWDHTNTFLHCSHASSITKKP